MTCALDRSLGGREVFVLAQQTSENVREGLHHEFCSGGTASGFDARGDVSEQMPAVERARERGRPPAHQRQATSQDLAAMQLPTNSERDGRGV